MLCTHIITTPRAALLGGSELQPSDLEENAASNGRNEMLSVVPWADTSSHAPKEVLLAYGSCSMWTCRILSHLLHEAVPTGGHGCHTRLPLGHRSCRGPELHRIIS